MNDETPRKQEAPRGFSVFYKGKTLLSTVDPAAQSERVIAAAHKVPRTLYFCPSPLYGYGLVSFLEMMSADSVFLCVEADERLIRIIQRDVNERGRGLDKSILHYEKFVKPMHQTFIEPSKKYANIIIPEGGHNAKGIDILISKIKWMLQEA